MSSHKSELYYCEICGAKIVVEKGGDGTLNCCNRKMGCKAGSPWSLTHQSTHILMR